MGLSARLQDLVNTCVEEYIKLGVPVASGALEGQRGNTFSSATIRSDLNVLEQMGYLKKVHTSGGRFPTGEAYKTYIDCSPSVSFVGDLVNDLHALSMIVERIDRKLHGTNLVKSDLVIPHARSEIIYRLLEIPDLEISALYYIIKERLNGRG